MPKNYIIFYDANTVTFPVKAERNPYHAPPYCQGYPQFFGGASSQYEGTLENLIREVEEESCRTLQLNLGLATLLHEAYTGPPGRRKFYEFYCSKSWSAVPNASWPDQTTWLRSKPAFREMCWVAQAPKAALTGLVSPTLSDVANYPVSAASAPTSLHGAPPPWVATQIATSVDPEFLNSHTLAAFEIFRNAWKRGDLP